LTTFLVPIMNFFFEKKGGSCSLFFYQKAAIEKKGAPAAGFIQKDTSRTIASKFGGYDIKVLAFSFHFSHFPWTNSQPN